MLESSQDAEGGGKRKRRAGKYTGNLKAADDEDELSAEGYGLRMRKKRQRIEKDGTSRHPSLMH